MTKLPDRKTPNIIKQTFTENLPEMSEYSSALNVSSFSVGKLTNAFIAGKYAIWPLLTCRSKVSRYLNKRKFIFTVEFRPYQLWQDLYEFLSRLIHIKQPNVLKAHLQSM